jgi:hypothetical protein
MRDFQLSLTAEYAEVERRVKFRNAALSIYWEQMPQEKWDELEPEAKGRLLDLVAQWRTTFRKEYLESLPIADRRRLEAMEHFKPEDWQKPGVFEP